MDPLTPTTGTLGMSVGYIAETAARLAEKGGKRSGVGDEEEREKLERKSKERETVRWVLGTPRRLRKMNEEGGNQEAGKHWEEVKKILDQWEGVKGVDELRKECEKIMSGD